MPKRTTEEAIAYKKLPLAERKAMHKARVKELLKSKKK